MYAIPNAGNLATNPTPYNFGILQEVSVDFKGDLKKLYGQYQFAVEKARGKIDVTCKGKLGTWDPNLYNQLYFGQAQAAGMNLIVPDEADTVPATSPYTITAQNAGTSPVVFQLNYGVKYAATGQQMILVTSSPTVGQYSVNLSTGVYTFAAADEGVAVLITYTYSVTPRGTSITLTSQLMGYAPEFRVFLFNNFRNKFFGLELYDCTMGQISIPTKQEDFWICDITFDASCDASNTLGKIYADVA
jgi:hypothetical protein